MFQVYSCLTTQHDWRLVLTAAVLCIVGVATTFRLLSQARRTGGRRRGNYLILCGLVCGAAVWGTHFIAMLGYSPGGPVAYAIDLTALSLGIVITGVTGAALVSSTLSPRLGAIAGGALFGAVVAAMHFTGMAGMLAQGRIAWDIGLVGTAVLGGMALWIAALWVLGKGGTKRTAWATALGVLAICALHFIAMGAVRFAADPAMALPELALSETRLAIIAAVIAAAVVCAGAVLTGLSYWSRSAALTQIRDAIDAMPDGLAFYDAQDHLVIWNARYAEVNPEIAHLLEVGRPFSEILRAGLDEGHYTDAVGREDEWLAERLTARGRLSCSLEQQLTDRRWIRVQDRRTSDGGVVTVVTDITDLKDDAAALARARDAAEGANRAKSEFLANMSHEIRTPLNGVIGVAQALSSTQLDARQREMLDLIQSSSHTLQHLLSDILDLARVESGRMEIRTEPFALGQAVREAAQLYGATAREKGLQFFVEVDPACETWVEGDVTRIKQILTNLVSNAVKFTEQGFVGLTVAPCGADDATGMFRFTVEDTGIGFDGEAKTRLFQRFEQADGAITRRFGGTGLGLAICRQLAAMMGGDLDCESEPGGGSAFILTLPFAAAAAPEPAPVQPIQARRATEDAPSEALKVLLADDHPTNRTVVELIVTHAGMKLTSVEDGAQAVAAWRDGDFDVILMDMQMPVMDGLSATREIRLHEMVAGASRIPIVMLTANALPEHVDATREAGADHHLSKPFNAQQLLTLIAELAEGRRDAIAA